MKWSVLDQSPASEGSPEERAIQESLMLARQLGEIVINTWTFDPEARRHSYAILAAALGVRGAASVS